MDELTGELLDGRYRVLGRVGEGGMGSVWRAERVNLGRIVAVKMMNEKLPHEMSARRRFEREAKAMAKLEHPHCASVLDVGMHDDRPFVVMDFVSGQDLATLIAQGPVAVERAVEIVRQVLSGLAHAHEHRIVHRDIKPANIVLSQKAGLGDHVKILDFGLARLDHETSNLTAGVVIGTPSYMAPEQVRGLLIDGRADLYACGVLLFELLTGTKPFRTESGDPVAICMMQLNEPPPRLADRLPGEWGALEGVVARALEKDRDRRYATAEQFSEALGEVVGRPRAASQPTTQLDPAAFAATQSLGPTVDRGVGPTGPERAPDRGASRRDTDDIGGASGPGVDDRGARQAPKTGADDRGATPGFGGRRDAASASSSDPIAMVRRAQARRKLLLAGGGAVIVVVVIGIVVAATRGPSSPANPPPKHADAAVVHEADAPTAPPPIDPADELLARAQDLVANGRREAALQMLVKSRSSYPKDARIALLAAKLYFGKLWLDDGLKQARAALALDPSYKTDAELIQLVLNGFAKTPHYHWDAARFLHDDIGAPAKPYIEELAKTYPNPSTRARLVAELRKYR